MLIFWTNCVSKWIVAGRPEDGHFASFYNMLNISAINGYVIYTHNFYRQSQGTPMNRMDFMLRLHKQLVSPWQTQRISGSATGLSFHLRKIINSALENKPEETVVPEEGKKQTGPRRYCALCNYKKKRMTSTCCIRCNRPICGEHQVKSCPMC